MFKNFYENFYVNSKVPRKTEAMKQALRLEAIRDLMRRDDEPDKKTLVAGCGAGEDTSVVARRVFAFDLAFSAIKIAKQNFPKNIYLVADAAYLPFIDNSFDCIVCSEVIEHIPDSQKMLSEFNRILKPRGELIITTPNWISLWGLFRKLGELLLGRPLTAKGQPVDNWYTPNRLQNQLKVYFRIISERGIWYYPPCGRGSYAISDFITLPVFRFLLPLERFLSKAIPSIAGHILAVRCVKNAAGFNK